MGSSQKRGPDLKRVVVAVVTGGPSSERDIALATGAEVLSHLSPDRFEPVEVEVLASGEWRLQDGSPLRPEEAVGALRRRGVGAVFPALHGRWGEDGTVQGFFEVAGVPCVGSGVSASALAMDKPRAREVAAAHEIRVPTGVELTAEESEESTFRRLAEVPTPAVVKDPMGGSSIGVQIAADRHELHRLVSSGLSLPGGRLLVEELITGQELTCAVLGNASVGGTLRTLPPVLIRPLRSAWFDFDSKYDPAAAEEICPAPIPDALDAEIRRLALLCHRVFRCDGLTRTDFLVPEDGVPRFLEVNTLPGLTSASLCPRAAAADGCNFSDLLGELVDLALSRAAPLAAADPVPL